MAFWAVYSKPWFQYRRKNIPNMISLYKEHLYLEWFNSLPEEEKQKELKEKEQKRNEIILLTKLYNLMVSINYK